MPIRNIGIIMNGVTGRMGTNQHLIRSILAIREQGGAALPNGDRIMPDPILVCRREHKVRALAEKHGLSRWSTDLDACLTDPYNEIFFDSQTTVLRADSVKKAIQAGKHVYCEKPTASTLEESFELAGLAQKAGIKNGVVQDKLFLPGLIKLKRLVDTGFFGRRRRKKGAGPESTTTAVRSMKRRSLAPRCLCLCAVLRRIKILRVRE